MRRNYEEYAGYINQGNTGIFLCTCRGKLSEGLNFTDNLARACFIVGIPYQNMSDSGVILKKNQLDERKRFSGKRNRYINNNSTIMSGSQWYN